MIQMLIGIKLGKLDTDILIVVTAMPVAPEYHSCWLMGHLQQIFLKYALLIPSSSPLSMLSWSTSPD